MDDYPIRHRNHEIDGLAERYLKNCLPISWVVNSFQIDYGTDFNCEIATNNKVIGHNFTIQLKGKDKKVNKDNVSITLKRATINRWLNRLEPTMIVCYIIEENCGYWTWFQDETVDLTLSNESFTISIPKTQNLININWEEIANDVAKIFSKRHLLYEVPKMNKQNELGWECFFTKKYEKACSIFYEIIETNTTDASIFQGIALSEYQLFNYQKALININKALELKEKDVYYINKASILVELGHLNNNELIIIEAIELFEKLIAKGYSDADIFYNYGNALSNLKDYDNALIYLKKSVELNPNKFETWNNLGNCYMNLGNHKLEMFCFENALLLNPDSAETLFSKGSTLFKTFGDIENGLKFMLQGAAKTERYLIDNPYVFFWIAEAFLWKSDFESSLKWNKNGLTHFSTDNFLLDQKIRINEKKNNS